MNTPTSKSGLRSEALPRNERIAQRGDFLRVYESGSKQFTRFTVVFARENDRGHPRIGVTITRKVGKANVRNRLRRWVREIYRTNRADLGLQRVALDFVVNVKPVAAEAGFDEFSEDLRRGIRRSLRRN